MRTIILTIEVGEAIVIGNDVEITIMATHHSTARLGIRAPTTTAVHRLEIYNRIQEAKSARLNVALD